MSNDLKLVGMGNVASVTFNSDDKITMGEITEVKIGDYVVPDLTTLNNLIKSHEMPLTQEKATNAEIMTSEQMNSEIDLIVQGLKDKDPQKSVEIDNFVKDYIAQTNIDTAVLKKEEFEAFKTALSPFAGGRRRRKSAKRGRNPKRKKTAKRRK